MSWDALAALLERLRLRLWFIPSLFAIGAAIAAVVLFSIDRALADDGLAIIRFGGTAEGARSVLSTVAQSMLTFTGLVFTITMLVLQLAANSLSPRVMRTFLRDRQNQVVLGLFVATFVFTLLVLREVRAPDGDDGFVPGLSIWASFALLLASVGAFIYYIDHMAHAIRASTVISNIAQETREAIDDRYPAEASTTTGPRPSLDDPLGVIRSTTAATLIAVDGDALVELATRHGLLIEVVPAVGDFVPSAAPLFRVYRSSPGHGEAADRARLADAIRQTARSGDERTLQQDPAFGIRQLVDVAARALSPGTNDPTTAVQAIDRIHDLLRVLLSRPHPDPVRRDERGEPRVIQVERPWEELVELAFDELRLYGAAHLHVARRLRTALADLADLAPEDRLAVVRDQLDRLDDAVARAFEDPRDRGSIGLPS
jgi:uncharacterized membrane protein